MESCFPLSRADLSLDLGLGCPALPLLSCSLTLLGRRQLLASCLLRPFQSAVTPVASSMGLSEVSTVQQHSEVLASPPPVGHILELRLRTSGAITESDGGEDEGPWHDEDTGSGVGVEEEVLSTTLEPMCFLQHS
ncbi:hypothetical protein EYF80_032917 [Liparis tanakae]|uniref:Uncharacterized protein n=1 Tax=Liparis tanakae TaxID=230148 RepID=A0A4Z2GU04_9TELE|nr:hypothetical protein EYF80_032917 [Liparis tanakae]